VFYAVSFSGPMTAAQSSTALMSILQRPDTIKCARLERVLLECFRILETDTKPAGETCSALDWITSKGSLARTAIACALAVAIHAAADWPHTPSLFGTMQTALIATMLPSIILTSVRWFRRLRSSTRVPPWPDVEAHSMEGPAAMAIALMLPQLRRDLHPYWFPKQVHRELDWLSAVVEDALAETRTGLLLLHAQRQRAPPCLTARVLESSFLDDAAAFCGPSEPLTDESEEEESDKDALVETRTGLLLLQAERQRAPHCLTARVVESSFLDDAAAAAFCGPSKPPEDESEEEESDKED
jgi:hypothetical protein